MTLARCSRSVLFSFGLVRSARELTRRNASGWMRPTEAPTAEGQPLNRL